MSLPLKTGVAAFALSALLMACTPADNAGTETAPGTETSAATPMRAA